MLDEWVKAAKATPADRVTIGRIGVGVMVRHSTPLPKITTVDNFKQALLSAESVVYNQASTGIYLEKLFERLAIAEQLKSKTVRYPDAAAVLEHIGKGKVGEIGLGATTVIIEGVNKGLKFVGPLPPEIQNYTTYAAAVLNYRIRFRRGAGVRPLPHRAVGKKSVRGNRHRIKGQRTCRCFSK